MNVTLQGKPVELEGVQPKVGTQAPEFTLNDLQDQAHSLKNLIQKPLIISVVPDINTSVCALQTRRFNGEAASIDEVNFVTVSNNTKEEQAAWCGAEGVEMTMLSDAEGNFGKSYGLLIPEMNRLARAIFVVNQAGEIVYEEIVAEIATEPDYIKALEAAKALV
ncbi:thiol peroxidase [Vagococcus silagei]|uniref:Thiol peroxidase n=1 Tax=Vagococcus silagei TaxID=2508885 RepID=A0A4S3B1K1_9ENTE|nr:thiol peroxidase [Vagococcus silagei]THB60308.1 thiol peroxidase [Vagococcus silagei]